jgi:hypothetical protein
MDFTFTFRNIIIIIIIIIIIVESSAVEYETGKMSPIAQCMAEEGTFSLRH